MGIDGITAAHPIVVPGDPPTSVGQAMKVAIIACMRELLDAAHCVLRTRTPVPRPQSGL